MLSKPNVKEVMPKVGNRYQSVLALAKRARQIEAEAVAKRKEMKEKNKDKEVVKEEYEENVFDAIDRAAREVSEGKVYVKINGKYSVTPEAEMEREIKEAQEKAKLAQEEE